MNENTPGKTTEAVYQPLKKASETIGLPSYLLRKGAKDGRFPCLMIGEGKNKKYYLNIPETLRVIEEGKSL